MKNLVIITLIILFVFYAPQIVFVGKVAISSFDTRIASIQYEENDFNEAIQGLSKALNLWPDNMMAKYYLSLIYFRKNMLDEANNLLDSVADDKSAKAPDLVKKTDRMYFYKIKDLKLDSGKVFITELLVKDAVNYKEKMDFLNEVNTLCSIIKLKPDYSAAYFDLIIAYINNGNVKEARTIALSFINLLENDYFIIRDEQKDQYILATKSILNDMAVGKVGESKSVSESIQKIDELKSEWVIIKLTNGKEVKGKIIEKKSDLVRISTDMDVNLTFYLDDIKEIYAFDN